MAGKEIKNVNVNGVNQANKFDAIVIGSGMSGGWAAKELCEKGLKTLVLERGRNVEHVKDYPTAMLERWQFPHRLEMPNKIKEENPVVSSCYAFNEATQHFFVKDKEHPYEQKKPFAWIRGYQVGGKSGLHGIGHKHHVPDDLGQLVDLEHGQYPDHAQQGKEDGQGLPVFSQAFGNYVHGSALQLPVAYGKYE